MTDSVDERVVRLELDNSELLRRAPRTISALEKLEDALRFKNVKGTAKTVNKEFNDINTAKLEKTLDLLQKRFSAVGIASATAISKATNSAIDVVYNNTIGRVKQMQNFVKNSIVTGGINRAFNLENAHFQMQGLLKDEKKVEAVMQNVSDSVDGTAYSLDAAAKAASQFAATGMQAGDEMFRSLRGIAGVAAMTNSEYESISQIFTTVAGNGRLMGDQLLQLSSRGINAAATLASQLGKTEGEVRDMVTKGQISFRMFAAAMDNAFGEHAKNANKTFTGALSNIKAALARIGAEFVSPLIKQEGPLVHLFNTIRARVNDVKKVIGPVAEYVIDAITYITEALDGYLSREDDFQKTLKIAGVIVMAFKNIIEATVNMLKIMRDAWIQVFPPATFEQIYIIAVLFRTFTENLQITAQNAMNLKDVFAGLFSLLDIWAFFTTKGISLAFMLLGAVLESCGWDIIDLLAVVGRAITAFDNWLWSNKYVTGAIDFLADKIKIVITALKDLKDNIVDSGAIEYVVEGMQNIAESSANSIIDVLNMALEAFKNFGRNIVQMEAITPISVFRAVVELFKELAAVLKTGSNVASAAGNDALSVIRNAVGMLNNYMHNTLTEVIDGTLNLFDHFGSGLVDSAGKLKIGFGEVAAVVTGFGIYKLGKAVNALSGVIAGFSAIPVAVAKMFNALSNVFNQAAGVLKAEQFVIRMKAVKQIAEAVLIIDAAIVMLAYAYSKDKEAFTAGTIAVAGTLAIIGVLIGVMSKIKANDAVKAGISAVTVGSSVVLMAVAISMIAKVKLGDVIKSLLTLLATIGLLALAVKATKKVTDNGKSFLSLIGLTASLLIAAYALQELQKIKHPVRAVGAMLAACVTLLAISGISRLIETKHMKNVIAMSLSLLIICGSLFAISKMDIQAIYTGLLYMLPIFYILLKIQLVAALVSRLGESGDGFGKGVFLIATSLIAFATGLLVIGKLNKETILKSIPVLFAFTAVMSALMVVSKYAAGNQDPAKLGIMIGVVSASIIALATAAIMLGHIDTAVLIKGVSAVSALMLVIGATMAIATKGDKDSVKIAGLTAVIGMLLIAVGLIATMSVEDVIKAVGALSVLMLSLGMMTKNAKEIKGKAIANLLVTVGILTLVIFALRALFDAMPMGANVDASAKVIAGIAQLLISISAATALLSKTNGKINVGVIATVAVFTGVVWACAEILKAMQGLDGTATLQHAAAIGIVVSVIGLIASLLTAVSKIPGATSGTVALIAPILSLAAAVAACGAILTAMGGIDGANSVQNALALGIVTTVIGVMATILTLISKIPGATSGTVALIAPILALAGAVAAVGGILIAMDNANVDPSKADKLITALSKAVIVIGVLATVLSLVGKVAGVEGALAGAVAFAAIIAVVGYLGFMMAAINDVLAYFGVDLAKKLDEAIVIVGKLGEFIGTFIGNIAGGVLSGMSEGVLEIGTTLAEFAKLFDGVDPKAGEVAKDLCLALLEIIAGNFVNGIANFLGFGIDFDQFSKGLGAMGTGIVDFALATGAVKNWKGVAKGSKALKTIAEAAKDIPNSGGLLGKIVGNNDLDRFAKMVGGAGPQLVAAEEALSGLAGEDGKIKLDGVIAMSKAISTIAEAADKIPNSGMSLAKLIVGDNSLDDFANMIKDSAEPLKEAAEEAGKLKSSQWVSLIHMAKSLGAFAEAADEIPNEGGVIAGFIGDNSLIEFCEQMGKCAEPLATFGNEFTEKTNFDGAISAAKMLKEVAVAADEIPNEGGALSALVGENGIWKFCQQLGLAAGPLVNFAISTASVQNWNSIPKAAEALRVMAAAAKEIPNEGGVEAEWHGDNTLKEFAGGVGALATAINQFSSDIHGTAIATFKKTTDNIALLVNTILGSAVTDAAQNLQDSGRKIVDASERIMVDFRGGINNKLPDIKKAGDDIVDTLANEINLKNTRMKDSGDYLMRGLIEGMKKGTPDAKEAAVKAAQDVDDAIRSKEGFDIHSPSLKAVFEGFMVMKGLAKGIDVNKFLPLKSISDVTSSMNKELTNGLKGITNGINLNSLYGTGGVNDSINKNTKLTGTILKNSGKVTNAVKEEKTAFEELRDNISDTLKSSTKLFEEYTKASQMNAKTIINNLKSQVEGIRSWARNLEILIARGLNKSLAKELAKAGPEAAGEIAGLISMSDKELKKVNKLYKERLSLNDDTAEAIAASLEAGGKMAIAAYNAGFASEELASAKTAKNNKSTTAPITFETEYMTRINNILTFDFKKAVDAAAKSMAYGGEALKKFADQFLGNTKNFKIGTNAIKAAKKAIQDYAYELYKQSDAYEEDMKNYTALTTERDSYAKRLKEVNKEIKKERASMSSNTKAYIKNEKKAISENNKEIEKLKKKNTAYARSRIAQLKYLNKVHENNIAKAKKNGDQETKDRIEALKAEHDNLKNLIDELDKDIAAQNDTMQEHIADAFSNAVNSISSSISEFLDPLSVSLENNIDLFEKFESSAQKAAEATKNLDELRKEEAELQAKIEEYRQQNTVATRKAMEEAQDRLAEVQDQIAENESTLKESTKISTKSILEAMKSQVDGVSDWQKKIDKLGTMGIDKGLLEKLKEMGPSGIDYVDQFINMTASELKEANGYFRKTSEITAQNLIDGFKDKINKTNEWKEGLAELANLGFGEDLIAALTNKGVDSLGYVRALLSMTPEQRKEFQKYYGESLELPEDVALSVVDSVAYAGARAGQSFVDAMSAISKSGTDENKALVDNAKEVAKILQEGIDAGQIGKDVAYYIGTELAKALGDTYSVKLKNAGKKGGKNIKNGVSSQINSKEGQKIAENLILGLEKGFKSDKATKAAKAVAKDIIKAVKDTFGIKSPSREFAEIARYNMLGFVKGIDKNESLAIDAVVDCVESTTKMLNDMFEDVTDITPTISPIIDLSEIQNGSAAIDDLLTTTSSVSIKLRNAAANSYNRNMQSRFEADTSSYLKSIVKLLSEIGSDDTKPVTVNNEFNLEGADPRAMANEVSAIIQRQIERRKAVWA